MKIAVAVVEGKKEAEISVMAGRAPYFLIFDKSANLLEVVKNPFVVGGGAGYGVARMLVDKGVDVVVAGKFGGNFVSVLEDKGIKYFERTGKANKVVLVITKDAKT